jgi:hypothetical protein
MIRPRELLTLLCLAFLVACRTAPETADPASDAPGARPVRIDSFKRADSYAEALKTWRDPEDLNAWIGARFEYDMTRAMLLSETQRYRSGPLPIHAPHDFFANPSGVCVDLARFAVETLRQIAPELQARYLMIEFAPVTLGGNTLRLHWMTSFTRDGKRYFLADSKRPGYLAGPYENTQQFIDAYARYRGRPIVAFRELDSYQRTQRTQARKQDRAERL